MNTTSRRSGGAFARDGTSITAWIALVVSILGLVVSIAGWVVSWQQLQTQKGAIEDQKNRLQVSAFVALHDVATGEWRGGANSQELANQRLSYEDFSSHEVFVVLNVYNIGDYPVGIKRTGLLLDGKNRIAEVEALCAQPGPTLDLRRCDLTSALKPQSNTVIYLRLNNAGKGLECNPYVSGTGLVGAVQYLDDRITSAKTQTYDPFSPICPGPINPTRSPPPGSSTPEPPTASTAPISPTTSTGLPG
jgi:hypothetical protein